MRTIYGADLEFVPASHENPAAPGAWKKVLAFKDDLQAGHVQMINWGRLPVGRSFSAHYHEDMQEIFIILEGETEMTVGSQKVVLGRGDAVVVDPHEVHKMQTRGDQDAEYVVVGIAAGTDGHTIVVE